MNRSPFDAPEAASRRGGPVKAPLSRDVIVAEALRQLTAHGLKEMSLRRVAAALETGAASLYAYVDDLDALHALVLDRALEGVDTRRARSGWRAGLFRILASYAKVLSASPGLAQLAFGAVAIGPNALRIAEAVIALLQEGGVDVATAAWAVDLLTLYVTAVVAEHAGGTNPVAPGGAVARAILGVSEEQYPRIHAAREHMLSGKPVERFNWAVEVLLQGIVRSPRETVKRGASTAKAHRTPKHRKRAR